MYIRYQAKRELKSGHSIDTWYELECGITKTDEKRNVRKVVNESLSGSDDTLYIGAKKVWDVTTIDFDSSEQDDWDEFIASIESGEMFFYSPYGTIASHADENQVNVVGTPIKNRVGRIGDFEYSFQCKEI